MHYRIFDIEPHPNQIDKNEVGTCDIFSKSELHARLGKSYLREGSEASAVSFGLEVLSSLHANNFFSARQQTYARDTNLICDFWKQCHRREAL
jgi:hypothetical protein